MIAGPPLVTVTAVSRPKVGSAPGCDEAVVEFEFSAPATRWVVRVDSHTPFDGAAVAEWRAPTRGFGRTLFGAAPFGRGYLVPVLASQAVVPASALRHGRNTVVVYAQDESGAWSPTPATTGASPPAAP